MAAIYFRTCTAQALAALVPKTQNASSADQQARRKNCQQLKAAVQELISKSNFVTAVPELLLLAQDLHDHSEYALALQLCCYNSSRLLMSEVPSDGHAALAAQVKIVTAKSAAANIADSDPELLLSDSVAGLVAALTELQTAMQSTLPVEQHHWLVLYGAYTLKWITCLFTKVPGPEALQFLVFACLALEADANFSLPAHLPLRVELYLAVAQSQQSAGNSAEALTTVQRGLSAIASIEKLEQLDPLPPPPEAQAAYMQAKTRLNTAMFAMSAPSLATEQIAKDNLDSTFESDADRLAALACSLLPAAPARVLKQEACPASHSKLIAIAERLLTPVLQTLMTSTNTAAASDGSTPSSADVQTATSMLAVSVHQVLTCTCSLLACIAACSSCCSPATHCSSFNHNVIGTL